MSVQEKHLFELNEPSPRSRLKNAFNLRELLDKEESIFEISAENEADADKELLYFEDDEVSAYIKPECLGTNDEDNDCRTPFEILKSNMFPIDGEKKVYKRVTKMGIGNVIPEDAVVYFHYSAYTELDAIPFDVTFLRSHEPLRCMLKSSGLVTGLHLGLQTMKKQEKAQFLVHPDLAYGKMGCPPRIPPDATILFEVELVRFSENQIVDGYEELNEEDKQDFSNVIKFVKSEYAKGLEYSKLNNPRNAAISFKKALGMLLSAKLKDDNDEKEQRKLLLKLYSNLMICYSCKVIERPEKVCMYASDALRDCGEEVYKHAKMMKFWGNALFLLNSFKKATKYLEKSKELNPDDKEVHQILEKVEKKQKQYLENEKLTYRKMFGFTAANPEKEKKLSETALMLKEQLENFNAGSLDTLRLPPGLGNEDENFCLQFARSLGLYARCVEGEQNKTVVVTKPDQ